MLARKNITQLNKWNPKIVLHTHMHTHTHTHIHTHTHMHTHTDTHTHKADRWVTSINKLLSFCLCGWPVHTESCSYTHWACSWGGKKIHPTDPTPSKNTHNNNAKQEQQQKPSCIPLSTADQLWPHITTAKCKTIKNKRGFQGSRSATAGQEPTSPSTSGRPAHWLPGTPAYSLDTDHFRHLPTAWALITSDTCLQAGHWPLQTPAYSLT